MELAFFQSIDSNQSIRVLILCDQVPCQINLQALQVSQERQPLKILGVQLRDLDILHFLLMRDRLSLLSILAMELAIVL
jgi:hypothetical protein